MCAITQLQSRPSNTALPYLLNRAIYWTQSPKLTRVALWSRDVDNSATAFLVPAALSPSALLSDPSSHLQGSLPQLIPVSVFSQQNSFLLFRSQQTKQYSLLFPNFSPPSFIRSHPYKGKESPNGSFHSHHDFCPSSTAVSPITIC